MSTPAESSKQENTYFIDSESSAEMARLIDQDRIMTSNMGGLFPEDFDLSHTHRVLDVACGPGGWARDVALTLPSMQVVGIDISRTMIEYAQAFVTVQKIKNAEFRVMDVLAPLDFADNSFDYVNARLLVSFMLRDSWPTLLQEMKRILRPSGTLHLTEADNMGTSNSSGFERINNYLVRAFYLAGRSFDAQGHGFGITDRLEALLHDAGFEHIEQQEHILDLSAGSPSFAGTFENYKSGGKLLEPFLLKAGVTTQAEFDQFYNQGIEEMLSPNFQGQNRYKSVRGQKPAEQE